MTGPGYLTGRGLWFNLYWESESMKAKVNNRLWCREGMFEPDREYLRCDPFPPDHGKAATLNWLDCFFGFVQLWWLRINLCFQVKLEQSLKCLSHLTGEQGVGVEHAVLQQVGDHVPATTHSYN